MPLRINDVILSAVLLAIMFSKCESIKCFDCNSVNNSACLDLNLRHMNHVIPVVDCAKSLPEMISKQFFCRKMVQTILDPEKTPEVRVMRSCGWVRHKKECYKADNADHLETVCQCFGDMCNAATALTHVRLNALAAIVALLAAITKWRTGRL